MMFKEIENGIIISCTVEEQADYLTYHFQTLDYTWKNSPGEKVNQDCSYWIVYKENTCYKVDTKNKTLKLINFMDIPAKETENLFDFNQVIINALDTEETKQNDAYRVLNWLVDNADDDEMLKEVFGKGMYCFEALAATMYTDEIIKRVSAFIEKKKKMKDRVQESDIYLVNIYNDKNELLWQEHFEDTGEKDKTEKVKEILSDYALNEKYYAKVIKEFRIENV